MLVAPQAGDAERILSDLSNDLMSPYCPGRTIASCPSDQARKLEDHILAEAKAGKSRDEIEQELVDQFGPQIVGYAPVPAVLYGGAAVAVCGLLALAWVGRRWLGARPGAVASTAAGKASAPAGGAAATGPTAAERERLEDALDEVDEF